MLNEKAEKERQEMEEQNKKEKEKKKEYFRRLNEQINLNNK